MYLVSRKIKQNKVRNRSSRLRAALRHKNAKRIARMLKP
jgi:hypothetical protein